MNKSQNATKCLQVSWKEVQGNKYSKSLHPAMLSPNGFLATRVASVIGKPKGSSEFVTIVYDKNYVISWLERKFIKPMENCELEELQKLIVDSYIRVKNPKREQLLMAMEDEE